MERLRGEGVFGQFELGLEDYSTRLQIPAKLYGREAEVNRLQQAFVRTQEGDAQILLISCAGVGKTTLAHEIRRTVAEQQGIFIEGKFDQYQQGIPFSAWAQAFAMLVERWLAEDKAQLDQRCRDLREALGENSQVLVEIIPELELVLGPQPPAPELAPDAASRRLGYLFHRFLRLISTWDQPLVIFLDDLQWSDAASLDLLRVLHHTRDASILLIAAYRDDKIDGLQSLLYLLQTLDTSHRHVDRIHLATYPRAIAGG